METPKQPQPFSGDDFFSCVPLAVIAFFIFVFWAEISVERIIKAIRPDPTAITEPAK